MEAGINLTGYDFVVIGLFVLFIGRGIWVGLLRQVTSLVALFVAYIVASQYHDRLFPFLKEVSENPKVVFVVAVVILFVATYVITFLLGRGLAHVIEITIAKWFDRFLGAMLGAVKAAVIVVLMHMILGSLLAPENPMLRDCATCSGLNEACTIARDLIRDEDVRKALSQQTPAITTEDVREFFKSSPTEGDRDKEKKSGSPAIE